MSMKGGVHIAAGVDDPGGSVASRSMLITCVVAGDSPGSSEWFVSGRVALSDMRCFLISVCQLRMGISFFPVIISVMTDGVVRSEQYCCVSVLLVFC